MTILESERKRKEILKNMSERISTYAKSVNNNDRTNAMANLFLDMRDLCDNDAVFIDEVVKKAKSIDEDKKKEAKVNLQKSKEKPD